MAKRFDAFFTTAFGNNNVILDGSLQDPQRAEIEPPAGKIWHIYRMIVTLKDAGTFVPDGFGAGSRLVNGVLIHVEDDNDQPLNVLTDEPIRSNGDWGSYCYDLSYQNMGALAAMDQRYLLARWSFAQQGGPIIIASPEGTKLVFIIQDDITFLTLASLLLQGREFDEGELSSQKIFDVW